MGLEENYATENRKNNRVCCFIGSIIAIVCILVVSFAVVSKGRVIHHQLKSEDEGKYDNYEDYLQEFLQTGYQIYRSELQDETDVYTSSAKFYFGIDTQDLERENNPADDQEDYVYDEYDTDISQWSSTAQQKYKDINELDQSMYLSQHLITTDAVQYAMYDEQRAKYYTQNELTTALKQNTFTEAMKEQYPMILRFSYDKNGKAVIETVYGTTMIKAQKALDQIQLEKLYPDETITPVKNCTIVLGINEDAVRNIQSYEDGYYYNETAEQFITWDFMWVALSGVAVVVILSIILMVSGLLGRKDEMITRIPVEVSSIGLILLAVGYVFMGHLTYELFSGDLFSSYVVKESSPAGLEFYHKLQKILPVISWFIYLGLIFIACIAFFQIFRKGFKRFFKENCMIYRFCSWNVRSVKRLFEKITSFDFDDSENKVALIIVGVNAVIISVMCSIWIFGFGVLIVYSTILFFVLRNYLRKSKENYNKVLNATEEMAKGNLQVEINEDLGLFNPLKKELLHVKDGFSRAVEEEVKSQQMKNELITNVSHDLKTPLTAIITYIELLKEDSTTEEQRKEYIQTLSAKSLRLKQLIEDLFEVSKLNSNNVQLNLMDVDIIELIKQAECEFEDRFQENAIELRSKLPEEKVMLYLDSQKTYRVFENLFGNIVKYAMPNTRAYIDVTKQEDQVTIILRNVSQHEIEVEGETLTERFVRGEKSRNTEGSGLGLAIVKSLVEKQGGDIQIIIDGDLFKIIMRFPYIAEETNIPYEATY